MCLRDEGSNFWKVLLESILKINRILAPYIIAQHDPSLIRCIRKCKSKSIISARKSIITPSQHQMSLLLELCLRLSFAKIHHTLRPIKPMSCTLKSNNSAYNSILEFNNILKAYGMEITAYTVLWIIDSQTKEKILLMTSQHLLHLHHSHQCGQDSCGKVQYQQNMHSHHWGRHHQDHHVCSFSEGGNSHL